MKNATKHWTWIVMAGLAVGIGSTRAAVVEEHFDYPDVDSLMAVWQSYSDSGFTAGLIPTAGGWRPAIGPVDHEPYMILGNGIVRRDLPQTLSPGFDITYKILHTDYQRTQWLGLFNAAGTQGYALAWDGTTAGVGVVRIYKFDLASEISWSNQSATVVGDTFAYSGHYATQLPFANFEFIRHEDGALVVNVDGVEVLRLNDTSFFSFSRIYIRGNTYGLFDDIVLTSEMASVTGMIQPQSYAGDLANVGITVEFRQGTTLVYAEKIFPDGTGAFSFPRIPSGTGYTVSFTTDAWLKKTLTNVTIAAPSTDLGPIDLVGGDSNGDDHVSFEDFSILQNSYGQSVTSGPGALAAAAGGCGGLGAVLLAALALCLQGLGLRSRE